MNFFQSKTQPLLFALALISLSGCATLFSGTSQELTFDSEPKGSTVSVNGTILGVTPITTKVSKKEFWKNDVNVSFEKEGYKKHTLVLNTELDSWVWGDIICSAPLSTSVDAGTGAALKYDQDHYYITLAADSSTSVNGSSKKKVKEFIMISYKNLLEDLSKGKGSYLSSLLEMLKVSKEGEESATQKIKALSTVYSNIPEFAEQVAGYYLK